MIRPPAGGAARLSPGRRFDLLALLAVAAFVAWRLHGPPPAEAMQADSQTYLDFLPIRSAGYPLFLRAVRHLPGGLAWVPPLQLAGFAAAAWFLATSFRSLAGSLAAAALLVMLLGNGQVTRLCFMIMTEAPFLALVMAMLGLLCRLTEAPGWRSLALLSLAVGLAAVIRPVGYALIPVLPVVAWWCRRDGAALASAAAAAPLIACLGLGIAAFHAEHGLWRSEAFLGSNLYGKAAAIVDAGIPGRHAEITAWMAETAAPDHAAIASAPTLFDRFRLRVPYYDLWRWKTLHATLPARAGLRDGDIAGLDDAMAAISLDIIRARPAAYLGDVALNDLALWTMPDAMTHAELARFRAWLATLGPLPDLGSYPPWHVERPDAEVWGLRLFMLVAFVSSIVCAAACLLRRRSAGAILRLGAVAGMMVHGTFLLTALLQAGVPRYVWAVWPCLATLVVLAVAAALRRVPAAIAGRRAW